MMKRLLIFTVSLFLIFSTRSPVAGLCSSSQSAETQQNQGAENPCWKSASTQLAMNECAAQDLNNADAELNKAYQQVLAKYANDSDTVARIKKAQRAWIAFRDAEIEALFPENGRTSRGSVFVMCRTLHRAELTSDRVNMLKKILDHKEGDVCTQ